MFFSDDEDTISLAKEVEEDECPVMDIEASMGRPKRIKVSQGAFSIESVPVPIPTPSPTPSLSTHPPLAPTPPFTSNPTPRPPIPTPSLPTNLPPAPTPPLTSDPNTRQVPPYVAKRCNRYWTVDIEDSLGVKRDGRLKTNGVWTLPAGQQIVVPFNMQGQPIGEVAGLLSGFLGIIGTDLTTFPISYYSWNKVPSNYKDTAFSNIKAKFCLDNEIAKCFVLKKLGNNWRNYRGWLFHTFYEVEMSREHNLDNDPDFIPYDMWAGFVDYRLNPRTQEISKNNHINRRKLKVPYTCGSKALLGRNMRWIPLNYSNRDTTNALQQEIVRLQSELESSNARLQASNAQLKLEMRGAKLVIQIAEFMVLKELELSWSQPELIWNLWIEEKLTL
ncbi:uncharacterized protein G2W53_039822 [Senna tora]|uniref:Uncharacterized protein n=1 Tax=Senna tora TaxID=362788 RepID=A0A834SQ83_9FABA|nr:uncharacterized protein G2W53_039822 [Senna tora]